MAENLNLIKFHKGLLEKVNAEGFSAVKDNFYLAEDARRLYVGLENGKAALLNSAIRVYDKYSELNTDGQYKPAEGDIAFIKVDDSKETAVEVNALILRSGDNWVQINTPFNPAGLQLAIEAAQSAADDAASAAADAQSTADQALAKAGTNATAINGLNATVEGHTTSINGLTTRVGNVETAINDGDNSLAKLRQAITDNTTDIGENATAISNLDTYVKVTVEPKAQKGIDDAKTADDKAVAAREVADEAKATADANKLVIENETTGLGALNTKVGELASADTQLDGKITTLTNRVKDDEDNLATNYYTKEDVDDLIDSITGTGEDGDVTSIAGLKIYVDKEVEDLSKSIGEVNTAVSDLETRIDNVTNVMNFRGVFDATSDVTDPKVGDVIVVGALEYVYVEKATDEGVVSTWEPFGTVSDTETRFQGIETRLGTAEGKITTAEGKIETLETKVGTLETTVSGHGTKIETIEGNITTLDGKIDGVAGNLATEAERADAAEKALDKKITDLDVAYKAKDGELSSAIAGVRTDFEAADETINGKIDGLTTRLDALDTAETGKVPVLEAGLAAEIARAQKAESDLDTAYKAADAETKSYVDNALAWGTF